LIVLSKLLARFQGVRDWEFLFGTCCARCCNYIYTCRLVDSIWIECLMLLCIWYGPKKTLPPHATRVF